MIRVGDQIPLQLQLFDGATGKFPQAVVRNAAGTAISGSPFDLSHVASGQYSNLTAVMPSTAFVTIQYLVYTDAGHTTLDTSYSIDLDVQEQDNSALASTALDNTVWTNAKAAFIDAAISSRNSVTPPTAAAIRAEIDANSTKLDVAVSTRNAIAPDNASIATILTRTDVATSTRNAIAPDNAGIAAIKAKTDNLPADPADNSDILAAIAGIPTVTPPTVSQIVDGVWDEPLASHLDPGSTGEKLNAGATVNVQDIVDGVWDEPIASHLNSGSTGAKLNTGGSGGGGGGGGCTSDNCAIEGTVEALELTGTVTVTEDLSNC